MDSKWKQLELNCFEYLKQTYGKLAEFKHYGDSNATVADILVSKLNQDFYIEVKSPQAQCGQFVLNIDQNNCVFEYSLHNKTNYYDSTKAIIDYMNNHFDNFQQVSTAPLKIDLDKSIFYDWVRTYYHDKNVAYFMTKQNNFLIIPIANLESYFDIHAYYRVKKSGSSSPNKSNINEIRNILADYQIDYDLNVQENGVYLITESNVVNQKLKGTTNTYLLKKSELNNQYLIRKLSNTYHANVIFSIKLKQSDQNENDLRTFLNHLKNQK